MRKHAFPPLINSNSRILFLGTMPSEESLRLQQYYGHKSNQFWKILFNLFNKPFSLDYQERVALLINHHIALWDVLQSCEGEGSADTDIKAEMPNDFSRLFVEYPQIGHVFFTSKKAEEFYKKYVGFNPDMAYTTLPSPSSANARMNLARKTEEWSVILNYL